VHSEAPTSHGNVRAIRGARWETHAAEMITLRYGQNATSAGSLSSLPLTIAERKGFFMREGLNLDRMAEPDRGPWYDPVHGHATFVRAR